MASAWTRSECNDCEWMYADAGSSMFGKKTMAHLNPLRWSGKLTLEKAIADLEKILDEPKSPRSGPSANRPILLKVPANSMESTRFESVPDALSELRSRCQPHSNQFAEAFDVEVSRSKSMATPLQRAVTSGTFDAMDATVISPAVDATALSPQSISSTKRYVDIRHEEEHSIDVEVPEKIFHSVIKHVPKIEHEDVEQLVEVLEVHHHEELDVKEEWSQEVVETRIPRTTIREILSSRPTQKQNETEETVSIQVQLPPMEKIIEKPDVVLSPKVQYIKSRDVTPPRTSERTVEVPRIVPQPRIVAVPKVEHTQSYKEFIVPHTSQVAKVVEVTQEETIEKIVDVPQTHTIRNIRYIPEFIQEAAAPAERSLLIEGGMQSLEEAQAYIEQLETEKRELRVQLGASVKTLNERKEEIEEEKRAIVALQEEHQAIKLMESRAMKKQLPIGTYLSADVSIQ